MFNKILSQHMHIVNDKQHTQHAHFERVKKERVHTRLKTIQIYKYLL